MTRKAMTVISRSAIIIMAMVTGVFFFWFVPYYAREYIASYPAYEKFFVPVLVWLFLFAAVIFACFVPSWMICGSVSNGEGVFTRKNVERLKLLSGLLFADSLIFPLGMAVIAMLGASSMFYLAILMPLVLFIFAAMGIICYIVGEMVEDVAEDRETIAEREREAGDP